MKIRIVFASLATLLLCLFMVFSYYNKRGVPPVQVASAIITCTQTVCGAQATSPACAQLTGAVTGCFSSGINPAVCLAGIPALASVGYADVFCVVTILASKPQEPIAYRVSKKAGKLDEKSFDWDDRFARMVVPPSDGSPDIQQKAVEWLKTQKVSVVP